MLIFVIIKNVSIGLYKKLFYTKHKFKILYARPLKNGKYKVIYRCKRCGKIKCNIMEKTDFALFK
jgi:hypothetical protein